MIKVRICRNKKNC